MPSQYLITDSLPTITRRFDAHPVIMEDFNTPCLITPGIQAPIIIFHETRQIMLSAFGLTPFWARQPMQLINARQEGDYNQENNPGCKGAKGIILKPAFRKPIRSQRCLVIASAYLETRDNALPANPYLVYLSNHNHPFAMAGIFDTWLHPQTRETLHSFAVITTTANKLLQSIHATRMPVILSAADERRWLNPATPLSDITRLLRPFDSKLMNAYPINPINPATRLTTDHLKPIGPKLTPPEKPHVIAQPWQSGYHKAKIAQKTNVPLPNLADRQL